MSMCNYEKPDGWAPGHPEVLVTERVAGELGVPSVNYDSLAQFFRDDLQIPSDVRTSVRLHGRSPKSQLWGFHPYFTGTVFVNAIAAEAQFPNEGGTMRILAHEAKHRADSANRKLLTGAQIAARWAVFAAAAQTAELIPPTSSYLAYTAIGMFVRHLHYRHTDGAEIQARAWEEDPRTKAHWNDIVFPASQRGPLFTTLP